MLTCWPGSGKHAIVIDSGMTEFDGKSYLQWSVQSWPFTMTWIDDGSARRDRKNCCFPNESPVGRDCRMLPQYSSHSDPRSPCVSVTTCR